MMKFPDDDMVYAVERAKAQSSLGGHPGKISVAFSLSGDRGIIVDCHLNLGQQRVALELLRHPDPFAQMGSADDYSDIVCFTAFDTCWPG